jgi:hypothetical protein
MSACENLPQELIVAIVDNIRDDKKSLGVFSLVCKNWTNPARDHLFASLSISDIDDSLEEIKAANLTSTYTPFLRYLCLWTHGDQHEFWHEVIPFLADFRTPRLRSLTLNHFMWHAISPDERSALLRRFESIDSLKLSLYKQDTSNDIATIICSFPHLRQLILMPSLSMSALPAPSPFLPELRLPERLSILYIQYYSPDNRRVLEWLASIPEQLSSIHTFRIDSHRALPQDVDIVLKALGPSLEVFQCNLGGMFIRSAPTSKLIRIYPP